MPHYTLTVNGESHTVETDADTPLLWVLRDNLQLTGTKYGCGKSLCGTCTVHINGKPTHSCVKSISTLNGADITTIEGLSANDDHPLQLAWMEEDVPQCGYCHSGQLMTAASLLEQSSQPNDEDIDKAMNGVLCRCGTYGRIRKAIHRVVDKAEE